MIHYVIPYARDKQLAKHYNEQVARFPDEDWLCFIDGDAMFLSPDFGTQIELIIATNKTDYDVFTCKTNRVGNLNQCHKGKISNDTNINYHISIAQIRRGTMAFDVNKLPDDPPMSGVLILAKVSTFKKYPFRGDGMLGVDNNFHQDVIKDGLKVGIMEGVYVFHKYRLETGIHDKSHLK